MNEVIRGNFKLLYFLFFLRENFTHTKSIKKHKNVKQATFFFLDVFISIKSIKSVKKHKKHKNVKQVTFFLLDVFYEHKKHKKA